MRNARQATGSLQPNQTRQYVKGRSALSKNAVLRMGSAFTPQRRPASGTRTETADSKTARARRRRRIF